MSSIQATPASPIPLRICIVAENASFQFGGEASLPLHYFARLRARNIEVWLIVHTRTRQELETLFPNDQDRIQYMPDKWYHKLIFKLSKLPARRFSEATIGALIVPINQLLQRSMVRKLIREKGIQIVHQPIPVSPKTPSFISGLGIPVVMGPMNGGMDYPAAFRHAESALTRITVALGRSFANLVNNIIPGKKFATILLVANLRTRLALPNCARGRILEIPENGVDLDIWSPLAPSVPAPHPARFLFIGRLVDWKRLDCFLRAMVAVPGVQLEVIGDGIMHQPWLVLAKSLGVADRVRWLGWLPQPECASILQGVTALVLPSIYECGGSVVLEAMACAIPVIATAWGGPADYLDTTCGILIEPWNAEAITLGFIDAMLTLIDEPELRAKLGRAGRQRVEALFDWSQKIDKILDIYKMGIREFHP